MAYHKTFQKLDQTPFLLMESLVIDVTLIVTGDWMALVLYTLGVLVSESSRVVDCSVRLSQRRQPPSL